MYFMELDTVQSELYLNQELAEISHNNILWVTFSINKIFLNLLVVSIG
jgi:hypothetical protein